MMMVQMLHSIHEMVLATPDVSSWGEMVRHAAGVSPADWTLLAQQFDTDVFADARNFFNNFVQSGQLWALIIGIIIGYLLRGLTSYG